MVSKYFLKQVVETMCTQPYYKVSRQIRAIEFFSIKICTHMTNVLVKILISKFWLSERTVAMRVQLIDSKNHIWIHSVKVKSQNWITNGTSPNKVAYACAKLKVIPLTFPSNRFFTKGQLLQDCSDDAVKESASTQHSRAISWGWAKTSWWRCKG